MVSRDAHLRYLSVQLREGQAYNLGLAIPQCMGDAGTMSCGLDLCKTLPRSVATDTIVCRGLFQGVNKISYALLHDVS